MKIDLLVTEGCPNAAPTRQLIRELLGELGIDALACRLLKYDYEARKSASCYSLPEVGSLKMPIFVISFAFSTTCWERTVTNSEEAARLNFLGSPTVQIDGLDVEHDRRNEAGSLGCRLYRSRTGVSGIPPRELLAAAIEEALRRGGGQQAFAPKRTP